MKRKLYALLLTGAMMLSLAACGTSTANPSDSGADGGDDVPTAPATTPDTTPAQADATVTAGSQTIKLTLEGDEGYGGNILLAHEVGAGKYWKPDAESL